MLLVLEAEDMHQWLVVEIVGQNATLPAKLQLTTISSLKCLCIFPKCVRNTTKKLLHSFVNREILRNWKKYILVDSCLRCEMQQI